MALSNQQVRLAALGFSVLVHVAGAGLAGQLASNKKSTGGAVTTSFDITIELQDSESTREIPREMPAVTKRVKPMISPAPLVAANNGHDQAVDEASPPNEKALPPPAVEQQEQVVNEVEAQPSHAAAPIKSADENLPAYDHAADRQDYLGRLQAHIEAHKFYPRRARQLGIEGSVDVTFRLVKAGGGVDIAASGGHRLLNRAAERSVKRAVPLPTPPASLALPMVVTFTMRYDLQR
jgi:protein TonB